MSQLFETDGYAQLVGCTTTIHQFRSYFNISHFGLSRISNRYVSMNAPKYLPY